MIYKVGDRVKVYGSVTQNWGGDSTYLRGAKGTVVGIIDEETEIGLVFDDEKLMETEVHPKQCRKIKAKIAVKLQPAIGAKIKLTPTVIDWYRKEWLQQGYQSPSGGYKDEYLPEMLALATSDIYPLLGEIIGFNSGGDAKVRLSNIFGQYEGYLSEDDFEVINE